MISKIKTIAIRPSLTRGEQGGSTKKFWADHSIIFYNSNLEGVQTPHLYQLVISIGIGDPCYDVKIILIDNESSVDILFNSIFLSICLIRKKLQLGTRSLYIFDNRPACVKGTIILPITLVEFPQQATHTIQFIMVKLESTYNALFGRPLQLIFRAVASIPHLSN